MWLDDLGKMIIAAAIVIAVFFLGHWQGAQKGIEVAEAWEHSARFSVEVAAQCVVDVQGALKTLPGALLRGIPTPTAEKP